MTTPPAAKALIEAVHTLLNEHGIPSVDRGTPLSLDRRIQILCTVAAMAPNEHTPLEIAKNRLTENL